ncbi:MAG: peptidylprolyl isomerase [Anaerolineae bacterium]|nr:peptidylprolyl isomerase [Anaerolineae bacterium]
MPETPTAIAEPTGEVDVATPVAEATPSRLQSKTEAALQNIVRVDGTLATVDGEEITWEDYEPSLRQALLVINQQYDINWNDGAMQARLIQVQNDVLKQVVDRWLLRRVADEQGISLDEQDLQAQVDKEKNDILTSGQYASWEAFLLANGLTEESFTLVIRDTLLYNKLLLAQDVDAEGEQVHIAHIVVTDEALAQEIESRLLAGESFADLAAEYSIDEQTKALGGDLGWFTQDMLAEGIADTAFTLSPGQFSSPITTDRGYAIIQILGREMRELDARALRQRQNEAVVTLLDALRASVEIEYLVDFQTVEN